jgi:hypothetical protein
VIPIVVFSLLTNDSTISVIFIGTMILISVISTAGVLQSSFAIQKVVEKIDVRARSIHVTLPPPIGSITAYHLFLVYSTHGKQFVCQGFPFDPSTGKIPPDSALPSNPLGLLTKGRCIQFTPDNRDFIPDAPSVTVASEKDAKHAYTCFFKETILFNNAKVPYHSVTGPNSNSYTRTMLDSCDLHAIKPAIAIISPGWDISIDLNR